MLQPNNGMKMDGLDRAVFVSLDKFLLLGFQHLPRF